MQHILFFVMCSLPIQTFYPHQHSTVAIVLWNFLVHMNFPCIHWYFNGQGQLYSIQTHCTRLKALKGVFIFTIHSPRHRSYLSSSNTNTELHARLLSHTVIYPSRLYLNPARKWLLLEKFFIEIVWTAMFFFHARLSPLSTFFRISFLL